MDSNIVQFGKISFNRSDKLGEGSGGSVVYRGKFENRLPATVKRIMKNQAIIIEREIAILCTPETHSNVIRYFCQETDDGFTYIATEYGDFSLEDYIVGKAIPQKRTRERPLYETLDPPLMLTDKEMLQQCIEGLLFIHSQGFVHRNMKPSNLIIFRKRNQDLIKLSDFGYTKATRGTKNEFSLSGIRGTEGWIAKEIFEQKSSQNQMEDEKIIGTTAVDIFSMGCIFFYVLCRGKHPFGTPLLRCGNICTGSYDLSPLTDNLATDLIQGMIQMNPKDRLSLDDVKRHSYFLPDVFYTPSGDHPGLCVIVNQRNFAESLLRPHHIRYGTDEDRDSLSEVFQMFGFEIEIRENLTGSQLESFIKELAKRDFHNYQSLVICLLSHGEQGIVHGTDMEKFEISHLTSLLQSSNCPGLTGKPKVLIIQACQGGILQKSTRSPTSSTGTGKCLLGTTTQSDDGTGFPLSSQMSVSSQDLPQVSDFLQAYSTVEGFASSRYITKGAVFIRSLCEVLREEGHKFHLYEVLLRVNNKVAEWRTPNGDKQMPEIKSCLRKHFLLKRQKSGLIRGVLDCLERMMLDKMIQKCHQRITKTNSQNMGRQITRNNH